MTTETFQKWATDSSGPVALRLKQKLTSIECVTETDRCILYPPTYADIGYNIDTLSDGKKVALVDSVGSQANRMEPGFKSVDTDKAKWLVPQIEIALGKADDAPRLSLLDLAHRGADAVVQSSIGLAKEIRDAFSKLRKTGDAGPLCAIAPTSLVFGVWDSRGGSSEKRPRLVRSIIRAWDVEVLHAAAQFNSVWKELDETQQSALQAEAKKQKKKLSVKGFADAPATFRDTKVSQYVSGLPNPEARVLGGVLVHGSVERDVTINLVALRGLRAADDNETDALRKYLLGLALIAATSDLDLFLREGCHLRYKGNDQWYSVPRRGEATIVDLTSDGASEAIRKLASTGADHFRKKWPKTMEYTFDIAEAKKLLAAKEEEEVQPE
jgi:CRISPR-associated protein Csb1